MRLFSSLILETLLHLSIFTGFVTNWTNKFHSQGAKENHNWNARIQLSMFQRRKAFVDWRENFHLLRCSLGEAVCWGMRRCDMGTSGFVVGSETASFPFINLRSFKAFPLFGLDFSVFRVFLIRSRFVDEFVLHSLVENKLNRQRASPREKPISIETKSPLNI